jgi:hypothetical protein
MSRANPGANIIQTFLPVGWIEDGTTPPEPTSLLTIGEAQVRVRKFAYLAENDSRVTWAVPPKIDLTYDIRFCVRGMITDTPAPTSQALRFWLEGYCAEIGELVNQSFPGTPAESNIANLSSVGVNAVNDFYQSDWSTGAIPITGLAAGGEVMFKFRRRAVYGYAQKIGVTAIGLEYRLEDQNV